MRRPWPVNPSGEWGALFSLDFGHMLHSETGSKVTNKNVCCGNRSCWIQEMSTSLYTTVLQNVILGYWFHGMSVGILWPCPINFGNLNLKKLCYCRISQGFECNNVLSESLSGICFMQQLPKILWTWKPFPFRTSHGIFSWPIMRNIVMFAKN